MADTGVQAPGSNSPPHPTSGAESGGDPPSAAELADCLLGGKSVFLTGGAGVGKTHLSREVISACEAQGACVVQCGTTGVSALQLPQGRTLHSTFCLPVGHGRGAKRDARDCALRVLKGTGVNAARHARALLAARSLQVLVLDEVSMASAELFNVLDVFLRLFRDDDRPMGGAALLIVGDLLQLPPVANRNDPQSHRDPAVVSAAWKRLDPRVVLLTKPQRQKDEAFAEMLQKIRCGIPLTAPERARLSARERACKSLGPHTLSVVFKRATMQEINDRGFKLAASNFGSTAYSLPFPLSVRGDANLREELLAGLRDTLYMKKTSAAIRQEFVLSQRVMCVSNMEDNGIRLVNGDTGSIVGFCVVDIPTDPSPNLKHKPPPAPSLFYASGLLEVQVAPGPGQVPCPVVCFDRLPGKHIVLAPRKFSRRIDLGSARPADASAYVVPLISAFALTVHKVQGCTMSTEYILDGDCMDWTEGSFYVAMSRATEESLIYLRNYKGTYTASSAALQFYRELAIVKK